MANQNRSSSRSSASRRSPGRSGGVGKLLFGMLLGVGLAIVAILAYFYLGNPPVSVTDSSALWEPLVHSVPLRSRSQASIKQPPFSASEDVFEAAAATYRANCVSCHGSPGHDAPTGRTMVPRAPQFFSSRDKKATSTQQPGELYWKTAFGIRGSGMPAYSRTLTDTQLWQLSLLLHSASDELPTPVRTLLTEGDPSPQPTTVTP